VCCGIGVTYVCMCVTYATSVVRCGVVWCVWCDVLRCDAVCSGIGVTHVRACVCETYVCIWDVSCIMCAYGS